MTSNFWVVLKNGKIKGFPDRQSAVAWERSQEGRYHIYNANAVFMSVKNKGTSYRGRK
jgi:heme/copper-type cytochrome/quinol oxidase subunit 2